jgi:hypothetical protein
VRRSTHIEHTEKLVAARGKTGDSRYSKRKLTKITDEKQLIAAELVWYKNYAAILKAVGYSFRYISDTIMVQTSIVKSWFDESELQEKVKLVQEDIVTGAVEHLQNHTVELTEMLIELARTTEDDSVKLRAITEGLDRVGVTKVNKSESVVTKSERQEVDFSTEIFEKMEALPIESQEQIARLAAEMEGVISEAKGKE